MMKNIFLQFTELDNITWTCACIVKWKMNCLCVQNDMPSSFPKNKLKHCTCIWTPMTWPRALESTLPFKITPRNCWETAQLVPTVLDAPSNPNVDLFYVQQSSAALFCENYAKLYFGAKHSEKELNRGSWNFGFRFSKKCPFWLILKAAQIFSEIRPCPS